MRWLIATLFCAMACPSWAALQTNIGVLTCTLAETGDTGVTPPSQTRAMSCAFKPQGTGPEERYTGEIQKVGSDTALTGKLVLIWVVMGPDAKKLRPGLLEQTYVGELTPSASDAPPTPKMLVGKSDDAYALRPLTDNGKESPSGSVTVVVLKVKSVPT
jgi:Protein of unknown function (DUF992)